MLVEKVDNLFNSIMSLGVLIQKLASASVRFELRTVNFES